jgi:hypothetical protein
MDHHRTTASVLAALLVGAAVVLLWPEPEPQVLPPPEQASPHPQPRSPAETGDAAALDPHPPPSPPDDAMLRAHLAGAQDRWLALAAQAEASDDPATRALALELRALARQAPTLEPQPSLQPTAAFLLAERRTVKRLEGSGLELGALPEAVEALEYGWLGTMPMAPLEDLR